jgi:hypothetical protein
MKDIVKCINTFGKHDDLTINRFYKVNYYRTHNGTKTLAFNIAKFVDIKDDSGYDALHPIEKFVFHSCKSDYQPGNRYIGDLDNFTNKYTWQVIPFNVKEKPKFKVGDIVQYCTNNAKDNYLVLVTGFAEYYDNLFEGVLLTKGIGEHQIPGYYSGNFGIQCFKKFKGKLIIEQS